MKLSLANIQGAEMLIREQLKKVIGGDDGSGGEGKCTSSCWGERNENDENTFIGKVETSNCVADAGKCKEKYPNALSASCSCSS